MPLARAIGTPSPADKLKALEAQISTLQSKLAAADEKRLSLQDKLKEAEMGIGKQTKRVTNLQGQINVLTKKRKQLEAQAADLKNQFRTHRDLLAKQLAILYKTTRTSYLQIIFSAEDIARLQHALIYWKYLNAARHKKILHLLKEMKTIAELEQQIAEQTQKLQALQDQAKADAALLKQLRSNRKQVLADLNNDIHSKKDQLLELMRNKKSLEKLVQTFQEPSLLPTVSGPFSAQKHKLIWPTDGVVSHHFGSQIDHSELRYNGIFIAAPPSAPVYAVYPGKVIFANWLAGFGLLVIIDHGNHYMTLYAHNESLYTAVGQTVSAGEKIATIGNSGGFTLTGLYFEIRHNGKVQNPMDWLQQKDAKQ